MGAGNSKPDYGQPHHVFSEYFALVDLREPHLLIASRSTPTTFSPNLVNSLDSSNQVRRDTYVARRISNHSLIKSDSTRASNLELKIQSRITSELEKLAQQESSKLASSTEAASTEEAGEKKQFNPFDRLTAGGAEQDRKAQLSHESVSKEIEELRKKLAGRKKLE